MCITLRCATRVNSFAFCSVIRESVIAQMDSIGKYKHNFNGIWRYDLMLIMCIT